MDLATTLSLHDRISAQTAAVVAGAAARHPPAASLGRDLRQRLPEVFAAIDAQVIRAIQQGAGQVSMLFDPAANAHHAKSTSAVTP